MTTFGKRLKRIMKDKVLKQVDLASKTKISKEALNGPMWELLGQVSPSIVSKNQIGGYLSEKVADERVHIEEKGVYKVQDLIHSPNHYIGDFGLEVEEVLRNFLDRYESGYVAHRIGSAIEYLLRSPLKNGKQDLEKAKYNIERALEYYD